MDMTKAAHELATLLVAIASEAPACEWEADRETGEPGPCKRIGTHQVEHVKGTTCGEFCKEHATVVHETLCNPPTRFWINERSDRVLLAQGLELAMKVFEANVPRDYLAKTPDGHLLAVTVIIEREGKFACVYEPKCKGFPKLPGGGVESGQTVLEAATDEALQEVGVEILHAQDVYTWTTSDYEVHFVYARIGNEKDLKQGDAGPVGWVGQGELESHPIFGPSIPPAFGALEGYKRSLHTLGDAPRD